MSEPDYNLLDEPWIPVLLKDGTVESVGIRRTFERSEEIIDLACELPTQNAAVLRMLLAMCHRVIPLPDSDAYVRLWGTGLPVGELVAYCERWRERFFLFGGGHPFLQAPTLHTAKNEVSGLEKIIADVPNGSQFFTTRNGPALERIGAAEAALWLLHAMAYDPSGIRSGAVGDSEQSGGKGYPIGPSWAGQVGMVILRGGTLGETLLLNLVPSGSGELRGPQAWQTPCVWEDEDAPTAVRRDYVDNPAPIAISRILTWSSRRIRLAGDRGGVTGVVLAQGDKLGPQDMQRYEPMGLWRYSDPQSKKFKRVTYMPRLYQAERALWRSIPGMLPTVGRVLAYDKSTVEEFLRSATLEHLSYLGEAFGADTSQVRIEAVGVTYGPQNATIDDIYHDEVTVSVALLTEEHPELGRLVDRSVERTEDVVRVIANLASNLARATGVSGDGAGDGERERAREQFYGVVDGPYRAWLADLSARSDIEAAEANWHETLRQTAASVAWEMLDGASDDAIVGRDSGRGYINSGIAENYFWAALRKALPQVPSTSEGDKK
ncbi:MAG: type I-E CRISPR-associated protein Cse1/CasA [Pauljensenia sp.]